MDFAWQIRAKFPTLTYLPRPRPPPGARWEENLLPWESEYREWNDLDCENITGYFCFKHGKWVHCDEVRAKLAPTREGRRHDASDCPPSHAIIEGITNAINGQREEYLEELKLALESEATTPIPDPHHFITGIPGSSKVAQSEKEGGKGHTNGIRGDILPVLPVSD